MGVFDFLKGAFFQQNPSGGQTTTTHIRYGNAHSQRVQISKCTLDSLQQQFIAFDVETTGLSPANDRIIEIGAVLFVNQEPVKSFSSLVNANMRILPAASQVNHITDKMIRAAPAEQLIYPQLLDFLGEAIQGRVLMCAHNAQFDFGFLDMTLSRLGYDADLRYVDTLQLSKACALGLCNYKQSTLETHFGLTNPTAHRAVSDAENCGKILCRLLGNAHELAERNEYQFEWEKWFRSGQPYWEQGESARKEGRMDAAIQLFDRAKSGETAFPCLYDSYAKTYRKLKDYKSEVEILDEGIARLGAGKCAELIARREKASAMLEAQRIATCIAEEKSCKKAEKLAYKLGKAEEARSKPAHSTCRAVIQMDDSGAVIHEFFSISAAEREIGVNAKSIRAAATGVQKHAGGYCWRFKTHEASCEASNLDTTEY